MFLVVKTFDACLANRFLEINYFRAKHPTRKRTGSFFEHKQPRKVKFFSTLIAITSNGHYICRAFGRLGIIALTFN